MDYQHLLYFIKISECKNISKAAESLFVSQQALSKAVSRMEEELGVELFTRSRSGVELTDYGRSFLSYALSSVKRHDNMLERIGRLKSGEEDDSVHFAYDAGLLRQLPANFLNDFMTSHPGVLFYLHSYHADNYNRATVPESMNIMLTSTPPLNPDYGIFYTFSSDLKILLHRQNPLAQKESLSWPDLKSVPLVHINIESSFSRSIDFMFRLNNIIPQYIIDPNEVELLFYLCQYHNGITIFSSSNSLIPEWAVLKPFDSKGFKLDAHICIRRDAKLTRTEKELIEKMKAEFEAH